MPYRLRTFDPSRDARPTVRLMTAEELRTEAPFGEQILNIFENDPSLKEVSFYFEHLFAVEVERVARSNGLPRHTRGRYPRAVGE